MKRLPAVVVILTWAVLLLGGAFRPQGFAASGPPRPAVGYPAPDLTVTGPDGQTLSLADLHGKAVFLNFWASWCGPCRLEMPEIQRLSGALPEGTAILTVNMTAQESSAETALAYLEEHGYTFPVGLDPTGEAGERFGANSLPTSLFISPDGVVTARIAGPLTLRAMSEYLAAAASATGGEQTSRQAEAVNEVDDAIPMQPFSLAARLPESLSLGPAVLPMRALFWLAGALLAYLLAGLWAKRIGLADTALDLVLNLAIGGIVGAKLLYVLLDPRAYFSSPSLLLAFPYGPLALPGALVGGVALAGWGMRSQANRLGLLDAAAPALLLGAAVGALGSPAPADWALGPLLMLGGLVAAGLRSRGEWPGLKLILTLGLAGLGVTLADLAHPAMSPSGVTAPQLVSALVSSAAWLWWRR